ncbi:NuA4 histone acetyltransferase complex modulator [Yamadazyma tenuis]|uniref:GDS1 winged helix domain-containing protein n=1 Tax=Candida tenuis (strain ATCC 10573 / BCRC 21748 / CBS 615 / JCM 9827 / NBRC 10315 / NRRL Y-1498 / VKM Y-70) TaxID=590646 RepID=G3B3C9_CANTC|nr:uncharacterized protein CANTEDRAFT_130464 [Yamadazyma tenuis ATCC 10573]EGV64138.1 hypothetical protein CANTEDRAFT_130464 [Yamadazyma tenuis ATCC 10573]WEJ96224.1 NuA4 histone acetyltransferase complex modulator [Yamadazyma tenuis]
MALADRRPLDFPVPSTLVSPAFNPNSLTSNDMAMDVDDDGSLDSDDKELSPEALSPEEFSPTSRSISPDSLMNLDSKSQSNVLTDSTTNTSRGSTPPHHYGKGSAVGTGTNVTSGLKKPKTTPRVPIATGISTTIPVTGDKPKPSQKDDPSLEDDVLYAIFLILYEKDPEGAGMTVKQICDILVERHPEMANLSTKTSNLVSAKLNAYVKRVEKGDSSLKYALSRDWADASPKRMVYVYRGLLAPDFHLHVKNMMEVQKQDAKSGLVNNSNNSTSSVSNTPLSNNNTSSGFNFDLSDQELSSFEAGKQATLKARRSTMFDLGISRNSFLSNSIDKSNLFVPYSSAPVTASLKDKVAGSEKLNEASEVPQPQSGDFDATETESKNEFEDFEVFQDGQEDLMETLKKNGKRSKSMSYLNNKKHKILTAAAAAPRAPKTPCSHSPNAAAAAAALHAAAIKAINHDSSLNSSDFIKSHCNKKWLDVIRSGFLSQDIGTPEDISLSDLDKYF